MKALARVGATLAAAVVALGVAATPAQAVSCYGDYCSGQSPYATGCAADGRALASVHLYASPTRLDLMWSPTCKTQWAQFNTTAVPADVTIKAVQETGYEQGRIPGTNHTYQIYSPELCVKAYYLWPMSGAGETWCV